MATKTVIFGQICGTTSVKFVLIPCSIAQLGIAGAQCVLGCVQAEHVTRGDFFFADMLINIKIRNIKHQQWIAISNFT